MVRFSRLFCSVAFPGWFPEAESAVLGFYSFIEIDPKREERRHVDDVQGLAKEWSLGRMKRAPAARGGRDAGVTQHRDHSLADPCTSSTCLLSSLLGSISINE